MKLIDTINGMTSDNYKDRMRAEYWQLKIRMELLRRRATKCVAESIREDSDSYDMEIAMMDQQYDAMECYLRALEIRAAFQNIDLAKEGDK